MLCLFLLIPPTPITTTGAIDFERLSLADALRMQNQVVTVQFVVAHEPYEIAGLTVVGPGYWESEERLVALPGIGGRGAGGSDHGEGPAAGGVVWGLDDDPD